MTDIDPNSITGIVVAENRAKKRAAAMDLLTPDERAAVERARDEAESAALRAAIVGRQVAAAVEVPTVTAPGAKTSEGVRLLVQQVFGNLLAAAGSSVAVYAATKPNDLALAIISAVIASVGGVLGNQAASKHADTRATIKTGGA